MAEITKWNASQVLPVIRHNMRHLEDGNSGGNDAIQSELTSKNYSLVDRGNTCKEINQYRKDIEKECFKYNRKNLVHAVEVVVQCPADCPLKQKDAFFCETFEHICEQLPMGEKCVFVAEVHVDEKVFSPDGTLISKDHLHVMYVPAVPDLKHDNFQYKLCADELTKRATLREFHPSLQKRLDEKGIHATVYSKKSDGGKTIGLSVKQLKEITKKSGVTIDHSLTIDELSNILSKNVELSQIVELQSKTISQQQTMVEHLQSQVEKENLKSSTQQIISEKDFQISTLQQNLVMKQQENIRLQEQLQSVKQELEKAEEKVQELEIASKNIESEKEQAWTSGSSWQIEHNSTWGTSAWDNTEKSYTQEEEKVW